ncbi:PREDICTED: uncharacterized protein LOC107168663 [Diuraphis noxia]|uniref:uncharacterized protein LOC107168663 n=1 Tax=Diuraphis noxia TaxID=143948 RepID=UPI0007637005|nr:PREDICTED: uncharacterized protein LOC107168663 [Diuraphis noxia]
MKIFVLTIVILALNGCVTRATSLDPLENVEIDETKTDRDDSRTKRSGNIFSSLLKKKLGLLSSITGTSSGKSIGHFDSYPEHFEEPLSYNTKSFNLWGVKKAIMSSVFQAAKAITGGVIALKGQLIKAKGHAVVAKGKLMQTKGEAISNFGKTIATHAFDVHHEPQLDVQHSSAGLFNHLPVTPIHQPTSYGTATAFGYQGQAYPSNVYQGNAYQSNAYPNTAYQVAAPSYQTGFGVPQTGYDGGVGYGGYGGNGFTAKRAIMQNAQESTVKQAQSAFDKDSVHAGLLIFKPIKMPVQNVPVASNLVAAQSTANSLQATGQRPSQQLGGSFKPASSKTPQQGFGFQKQFPAGFQASMQSNEYSPDLSPGYQAPDFSYQAPNLGYQAQNTVFQAPNFGYQVPNFGYPSNGGSVEQTAGQGFSGGLQNFDFQQPANSQELGQQLATISGQQLQQTSFSQESLNDDQRDLTSGVDERMAQPSNKRAGQVVNAKRAVSGSTGQSTPSVIADFGDGEGVKTKKRSAALPPSHGDEIVPLKYHDDSTAEDQARLKQTVQRFFSMLQKQR